MNSAGRYARKRVEEPKRPSTIYTRWRYWPAWRYIAVYRGHPKTLSKRAYERSKGPESSHNLRLCENVLDALVYICSPVFSSYRHISLIFWHFDEWNCCRRCWNLKRLRSRSSVSFLVNMLSASSSCSGCYDRPMYYRRILFFSFVICYAYSFSVR